MDTAQEARELHKKLRGKTEVVLKQDIQTKADLALVYTPGVGVVSTDIGVDVEKVWEYTGRGNMVAVISDGSAVLGLGDLGPEAALPVMEGKCALFKRFANINAVPLVIDAHEVDDIVRVVKALAPSFGAINLEDISAPRCFEIEERLKAELSIPVMHDDQHGTAIIVLAGLINAARVVGKELSTLRVVVNGVGAAGVATMRLLSQAGVKSLIAVDSTGIVSVKRADLTAEKKKLVDDHIVLGDLSGTLDDALAGADVFIGVSKGNILTASHIQKMNPGAIIFGLANPVPEIMPDVALNAGAAVVATGRSDFPNQINNVLTYPGVFRGALDGRLPRITDAMKIAAARALASLVEQPTAELIIPDVFDERVVPTVAAAVRGA
jgi:malate dehydrogenase (oxaloacetate-decarboxylating)